MYAGGGVKDDHNMRYHVLSDNQKKLVIQGIRPPVSIPVTPTATPSSPPRVRTLLSSFAVVFLTLIVSVASYMPHTISYFHDVETSVANVFGATKLDFALIPGEWSESVCTTKEPTVKHITLENTAGIGVDYSAHIDDNGDAADMCYYVLLDVYRNDVSVYSGELLGFQTPEFYLNQSDVWIFEARVREDAERSEVDGRECSFDLVFEGRQDPYSFGVAFHDVERDVNTLVGSMPGTGGDTDVTVVVENDATVTNTSTTTSTTGGNTASSSGQVITGEASATSTTSNRVNITHTDVDVSCDNCAGLSGSASTTGETEVEDAATSTATTHNERSTTTLREIRLHSRPTGDERATTTLTQQQPDAAISDDTMSSTTPQTATSTEGE